MPPSIARERFERIVQAADPVAEITGMEWAMWRLRFVL
jgi:hypothetical protein